jgi:hypothetical protein
MGIKRLLLIDENTIDDRSDETSKNSDEAELLLWVEDEDEFQPELRLPLGGPDVFLPESAQPGDPILAYELGDADVGAKGCLTKI